MNRQYDLLVIGGGSGGLAVAERAAEYGKRVAIIEASRLGGTCVNNGCVPKKVMWYAANLAHAADNANDFGLPVSRSETNWPALVAARDEYIRNINRYWEGYVDENNIERIQGYASFIDAQTLEVNGNSYQAKHIVIATGGKPFVPPVPGAELGITSDGFFQLKKQPKRVAIIGGGYIGVELSGVLRALGSDVTLYAREGRLLGLFDHMISEVLSDEMQKQGVTVLTSQSVTALTREADGIAVSTSENVGAESYDTVIWAAGRQPNTEGLNLESAGVERLDNGVVPVDEFENTNVPGIYAVGDITGRVALTPVAIAAGRKLAERIFNKHPLTKMDYENVPSVVFTHPPIATVGMTEQQALEKYGRDTRVYKSQFTPMRYALVDHGSTTAMKLICAGEDERVVGIHIIGEGADEMLQGFAVALKMGARKSDFDNTIAIHPSSAEELVTMRTAEHLPGFDQNGVDEVCKTG